MTDCILDQCLQRKRWNARAEEIRIYFLANAKPVAKAKLLYFEVTRHKPPLVSERHLIAILFYSYTK
jgi:hypothetical protein